MEELSLGNAVNPPSDRTKPVAWEPLGLAIQPHVLAETLNGGQAFRWHAVADGTWEGSWGNHLVALRLQDTDALEWRPITTHTRTADVRRYLRLDDGWRELADNLPWRSDPVLATAMNLFPDLRLLAQPLGETLLAFLCSSTKQIVQIKEMMALLAKRFGSPLTNHFYRLPTWDELASVPQQELRACKLGYRARYIADTAAVLAAQNNWEAELSSLPYPAAKARLIGLPGVGEKIADCVLLFGAGHTEAFPVDTWILKVMQVAYGLEAWKPPQVAQFGRIHFGAMAGLAQQYLFAWARETRLPARRQAR